MNTTYNHAPTHIGRSRSTCSGHRHIYMYLTVHPLSDTISADEDIKRSVQHLNHYTFLCEWTTLLHGVTEEGFFIIHLPHLCSMCVLAATVVPYSYKNSKEHLCTQLLWGNISKTRTILYMYTLMYIYLNCFG